MMKKTLFTAFVAAQGMMFGLQAPAAGQEADAAAPVTRSSLARLSLNINGLSYHIGRRTFMDDGERKHFNEVNPGIGLEYRLNDRFHIGAGTYENSEYRRAWYAVAGIETGGSSFFGAGVDAGIVSGYNDSVMPAALPYVRLGAAGDLLNVKIGFAPSKPPVIAAHLRISPF